MSRRDTILIAVLINIGLLVILFATAVGGDRNGPAPQIAQSAPSTPSPVQAVAADPVSRYVVQDEVDQVLQTLVEEPIAKPPVAAAPPAPTSPETVEVTVKRGDSLDKIARANGTSVEELVAANDLSSTVLQIGQTLQVPLSRTRPRVRQRISTNTARADDDSFYTIQSGDNPWVIAMRYHIPLEELLALNNLDESTARKLKPGDKIRIR